jgi:hypothetical protein
MRQKESGNSATGPISDIEEFKHFLGPLADKYSESQLKDLQRDMHIAAELLLDLYLDAMGREVMTAPRHKL